MPQSPEDNQQQPEADSNNPPDDKPDVVAEAYADKLARLTEAVKDLDAHLADRRNLIYDDELRKSGAYKFTIFFSILQLLCWSVVYSYFYYFSDLPPYKSIYIILPTIFFQIALAVLLPCSFYLEFNSQCIQASIKPEQAFKRFFNAAKNSQVKPIMAALVPSERTIDHAQKIHIAGSRYLLSPLGFSDATGLKIYWKSVFSYLTESQLRDIKLLEEGKGGIAIVEAKLESTYDKKFSVFEALGCLFFFLGPLKIIGLLVSNISPQKKGHLIIRKILVRRKGKWYFISGELMGELDSIAMSM